MRSEKLEVRSEKLEVGSWKLKESEKRMSVNFENILIENPVMLSIPISQFLVYDDRDVSKHDIEQSKDQ